MAWKSGEAQQHLAALPFFSTAKTVALYRAQGFEPQTALLFERARAQGARVAFPRVVKGQRLLALHLVQSDADFEPGPLGLLQPRATLPTVDAREIDFWVVPGVGFTRTGARLGRGGGYYDATLALASPAAHTVGLCFDCCLVDELPIEEHDRPVEAVATESGVVGPAVGGATRASQPRVANTQL